MTPNQLPPLPEPHIGLPWRHNAKDGSIHSSAFTWAQMHAYALAALAQQTQPVAWLYVDTVGERYLCFSRPIGGGAITNLYATPPAPQPAPVDEREAFERWCGPFSELRRSDFDPGRYCHSGVSLAWDAWQARAALQSQAPQTKGQP